MTYDITQLLLECAFFRYSKAPEAHTLQQLTPFFKDVL